MPEIPNIPQSVRIYVAPVGTVDSPVHGCIPFVVRAYDNTRTGEVMWRGSYYQNVNGFPMYVAARQAAERECGVRNWHIVNPEEVSSA
jgi:hypothetical protein